MWSTFWETVSQLLTGRNLNEIISKRKDGRGRSDSDVARELQAELNGASRVRSDSEIARELQKEWDTEEEAPDGNASHQKGRDNFGANLEQTPDRSALHRNDSLADGID